MKKYELKYNLKEKIPNKINNLMLDLLFLELKKIFFQTNEYIEEENMNNNFFLILMMYEMANCGDSDINIYYKKILKKINSQFLTEKYINLICNELQKKDYERVETLLKSFIYSDLVKNAKLIRQEHQDYITLTLNDGSKINFSHIPLPYEFTQTYNGHCHEVTSHFVKDQPDKRRAIMTLLKNHLYGKYYHSFMVKDDIVYDLSHNIMMSYKDYIKIFNPKVLVDERGDILIKNIKKMYSKQKFLDSEWSDLAIYGILKS